MIWARRYDSKTKRLQLQGARPQAGFPPALEPGGGRSTYTNADQGAIVNDLLTR